jgi:(p)ppGpp synthase/HD superfamily hydrolase
MDSTLRRALTFATHAHAGQNRKYTGDPYIVHPAQVACIVSSVTQDTATIAAAYLHDTVEDTEATLTNIMVNFGIEISRLVHQLTDISHKRDGNRAARKAIDREHLGRASAAAQTVKLADLIDNSHSIVEHDPGFARVYMSEKEALLEVLTRGDASLHRQASAIVSNYRSKL